MSKKPGLTVDEESKIKTLLALGKTPFAVAKEVGRDPKTVKKLSQRDDAASQIEVMKKDIADQFEGIVQRMLSSVSDEDIQKISAYQRVLSAAVGTDKVRLLRGESTENIALLIQ